MPEKVDSEINRKKLGYKAFLIAILILTPLTAIGCIYIVGFCLVNQVSKWIILPCALGFGLALIGRIICTYFYRRNRKMFFERGEFLWKRTRHPILYVAVIIIDILAALFCLYMFCEIPTLYSCSTIKLLFAIGTYGTYAISALIMHLLA